MKNNNGIELDKKSLAEELSLMTLEEKEKDPNRKKTGLETEIECIINTICSDDNNSIMGC